MKYPNLNALVPEGEHFDESAINEGVYLTVAHINAIEQSLSPEPLNQLQQQLDAANQKVTDLQNQLQQAPAADTVANLNQQIQDLKNQISQLGRQSSGTGSAVAAAAAAETEIQKTGKPTLNDADHPLNQAANSYLQAKQAAKNAKPKF